MRMASTSLERILFGDISYLQTFTEEITNKVARELSH